ncbi:MAG: hypothetical protein WAO00_14840 [Chthoniobacterales bacterium]
MSLLGVHLSLWMGPNDPVPVPFSIAEALTSVEVTHSDSGPSGFQLTFQIGRSGPLDLADYGLLKNPLIRPFVRVILLVRFAIAPEVLIDGIITQTQLSPNEQPGASTLTVTGEDVSVMMDLEQEPSPHLAVPDFEIVVQLVGKYKRYGMIPPLKPPPNPKALTPRNPLEERTVRPANLTDRAYIQQLAGYYGFVFYVTPGPAPLASTTYWGPPERLSLPQSALSVNQGPNTNVDSISFRFDALRAQQITFVDGKSKRTITRPSASRTIVPLAREPAEAKRKTSSTDEDKSRVEARAQGQVDQSSDDVVTASGQLDALRYNGLLHSRSVVGLRGAGDTYDGNYYVKSVTHSISKGRYTQSFSLSRDGTGAAFPVVVP